LNAQAGYIAIVFFALFNLLIGSPIFRLTFLYPPLATSHYVSLPIDILGFVAEALLMLWLLAFGVNVRRWAELIQER
jgi:hypothetical protein